eukprot:scaffold35973_cov60-Phaeocystis_antarctica.AAC.2
MEGGGWRRPRWLAPRPRCRSALSTPAGTRRCCGRPAKRHPPIIAGVHHLEIVDLQGRPQLSRDLFYRGQALVLHRIALAFGATAELPRPVIGARVEGPAVGFHCSWRQNRHGQPSRAELRDVRGSAGRRHGQADQAERPHHGCLETPRMAT